MLDAATMAKKKSKTKDAAHRIEVVAFRCTTSFKEHLEMIADVETRTPTQVIERALKDYTTKYGYDAFPDR